MARAGACPICRGPHHRLGRRRPLDALRAAPRAVAAAVRSGPRGLVRRRPGRGAWSVAEVVGHLLDAEVALGFRLRKIAAEPRSPVPAWDQEKWTEGLRHRRAAPASMLAAFAALRATHVALGRRLTPAQRRQWGRHPEYGRLTVDQVLAHLAEHDLTHVSQIRDTWRRLRGRG